MNAKLKKNCNFLIFSENMFLITSFPKKQTRVVHVLSMKTAIKLILKILNENKKNSDSVFIRKMRVTEKPSSDIFYAMGCDYNRLKIYLIFISEHRTYKSKGTAKFIS